MIYSSPQTAWPVSSVRWWLKKFDFFCCFPLFILMKLNELCVKTTMASYYSFILIAEGLVSILTMIGTSRAAYATLVWTHAVFIRYILVLSENMCIRHQLLYTMWKRCAIVHVACAWTGHRTFSMYVVIHFADIFQSTVVEEIPYSMFCYVKSLDL